MTEDSLREELERLAAVDRQRDEQRYGPEALPGFARRVLSAPPPRPGLWARLVAPFRAHPFRLALGTVALLMVVGGGTMLWPRGQLAGPELEASMDVDPSETIAELDDDELERVLARLEKIR